MNTNQEYLPKHWKDCIIEFALKRSDGKCEDLTSNVFRGSVRLKFEDGSTCFFEGAFYVADEEKNELLVVTEHCGYHVFPLSNLDCQCYRVSSDYYMFD